MREMASKAIFESKSGSRERGAIWQNIADNLNKFQEFAVMARSLRDNFTTLMKKYKLKTRQLVWGIGLNGEELCENEQLLEDLIERFKESERRTEGDTQKNCLISKTRKRKLKK